MISLTVVTLTGVLILFWSTVHCKSVFGDFSQSKWNNPSLKEYSSKYLTPEKCNRSERIRVICKLLSKSKKFRGIEKYIKLTQPTTAIKPKITEIEKRVGFMESYDHDEVSEEGTARGFDTFVGNGNGKDSSEYPEDFLHAKIYKYPSLTKSKRKFRHLRIPRLGQLRPLKMKKFRSMVWPKVLKARNKLSELPIALSGIPFIWTLGIALMLKRQFKKPNGFEILQNFSLDQGIKEEEKNAKLSRDKFLLAKEVVSLTGETLNFAANKVGFVHALAKTLEPVKIGQFLANQRLNVNATLLNNMKNFGGKEGSGGNMTNLVGEFVRAIAEQAVRNVTDSITISG